jgi:hypothetical protein
VTACVSCGTDLDEAIRKAGVATHPTCSALPTDPDVVMSEVFDTVATAIAGQPRSQQTRIGPSEIGVPCDRRIGYKLAGVPEVNDRGLPWKPWVGTAIHEQLADIFGRREIANEDAPQRWHVEERVTVGTAGGQRITGTADLFDAYTGIVMDWKTTSRRIIRETYRPHGPGDQYRIQAHLYGRGFVQAGHDVRTVAIVFLARDGEWADRHVWHEPYDEQVALDALARLEGIQSALTALGPEFVLPTLEAVDAYCGFCPWYKPRAADLTKSCPGMRAEQAPEAAFADLLPTPGM